jgi:hypothetical protein
MSRRAKRARKRAGSFNASSSILSSALLMVPLWITRTVFGKKLGRGCLPQIAATQPNFRLPCVTIRCLEAVICSWRERKICSRVFDRQGRLSYCCRPRILRCAVGQIQLCNPAESRSDFSL